MERLAEQIVAWHNRHPLARRITTEEVQGIGIVALPFVHAMAGSGGFVEPVLTDEIGFDELAAGLPAARRGAGLRRWAERLTRWRRPRTQWRAFSEKFMPGLSLAQVERFALAHGFAEPPGAPDDGGESGEAQPVRVILTDDRLVDAHGGRPFELYLLAAGIEAAGRRARVLAGRGIPSQIAGRRLWDPRRIGLALGLLVLLLCGIGGWLLWPHSSAPSPAASPQAAASAPAAVPLQPGSAPAVTTQAASAPLDEAAPAPPAEHTAAAASAAPVSATASAPLEAEADQPQRSSRALLVAPAYYDVPERPPLRSSLPERAPPPPSGARGGEAPTTPNASALPQSVVALVGPAGSRPAAEALLKKMREGLVGVTSDPAALEGDVIQTPEGWRAAVWPFASREQAQLINATLVARGFKTKAVNF